MLDQFNILSSKDNFKIFYPVDTSTWQTWVKPRSCNFIWIMCIGPGAGGSGGAGTGGATYAQGGSTGAISRVLYPAHVLPDILYVQPGIGAAGGAGLSTNGNGIASASGRSFVSIIPSSATTQSLVTASGGTGATGPSGETAVTTTNVPMLSLGVFTTIGGLSPTTAGIIGSVTPFVSTVSGNASMLCPGSNGSGNGTSAPAASDVASTTIGSIVTPTITGGAAGSPGKNGMWNWGPIIYGLGGSGGGGVASGTAFNGGDANAYGCGGGGGGNSSAGTGGNGGRGGDGLIFIYAF